MRHLFSSISISAIFVITNLTLLTGCGGGIQEHVAELERKGDVKGLIISLQKSDYAIEALGRLGAVEALASLLHRGSHNRTKRVVAALSKINNPSKVPSLITILGEEYWIARAAIQSLNNIGEPARDALIQCLTKCEERAAAHAAMALVAQGYGEAFPILVEYMSKMRQTKTLDVDFYRDSNDLVEEFYKAQLGHLADVLKEDGSKNPRFGSQPSNPRQIVLVRSRGESGYPIYPRLWDLPKSWWQDAYKPERLQLIAVVGDADEKVDSRRYGDVVMSRERKGTEIRLYDATTGTLIDSKVILGGSPPPYPTGWPKGDAPYYVLSGPSVNMDSFIPWLRMHVEKEVDSRPRQYSVSAERIDTKQNSNIYYDKNGYFTALPPKGWEQKDYPDEAIRSKVEFINAQMDGVNIRVIATPVERATMTNDELLVEITEKIETVLKPSYPSVNWSAHKEMIDDREAVVTAASGPDNEQRIIQFIIKGVNYSIALNAKSKQEFLGTESIFNDFVSSFTILDTDKSISDDDRTQAQIARLKRIAILRQQEGHINDALDIVDEALSLDPTNAELQEFQQRLRSSLQ